MKLALALIVFGASIAVFFADEWTRLFKRIVAIPGVRLLVPLLVVSWMIEVYQAWGHWLLLELQAKTHYFEHAIAMWFPFETGAIHVTRIIYLSVLACLPAWFFWLIAKYKNTRTSLELAYYLGVVFWIFAILLFVVEN